MNKMIYALAGFLFVVSKQMIASDSIQWEELHEKAKTDPKAAYELGRAWYEGKEGLKQNPYKAVRTFQYAAQKGSEEAKNMIEMLFGYYHNKLSSNEFCLFDNGNGEEHVLFGLLSYKKQENRDNNIRASITTFEKLDDLNTKRKETEDIEEAEEETVETEETTDIKKKWLAEAYTWLGIIYYNEEAELLKRINILGTKYDYEFNDRVNKEEYYNYKKFHKAEEYFKKAKDLLEERFINKKTRVKKLTRIEGFLEQTEIQWKEHLEKMYK